MATDTKPLAPTDAEIIALLRPLYASDEAASMGAADDLRTARAVLAKWGTPAGAGEVVAHRVMRKSLSGEWASDARDWSDGPPSRALVDSICADKGRWRIDVAYAAPASVACEPLTDEQIRALWFAAEPTSDGRSASWNYARAIERARGITTTGRKDAP